MALPLPARARLGFQTPHTHKANPASPMEDNRQTFGREVPKTASRETLALDLTPRVAGGMAVVSMNSSGLPESFTELVGSVGQPPVAR